MAGTRTSNAIRNILFGLGGQVFAALLGIVCRDIFIRLLDQNYLGLNGLFSNILSMLSLMELGIAPAMVFSMYKPLAEKNFDKVSSLMRVYRKAYWCVAGLITAVGLGLLPILHLLMKQVPDNMPIGYIRLVFVLVLLSTVVSYLYAYKGSVLVADQKNFINVIYKNGMDLLRYAGQTVILAICWWGHVRPDLSFVLYLSFQIVTNFTTNYLISRRVDTLYPNLKLRGAMPLTKEETGTLKKNIGGLFFHKIGGVVLNSTDNTIISVCIGLDVVGIYTNYLLLINIIKSALDQVIGSVTAGIGNLFATETKDRAYHVFRASLFMNYMVYGFSFICFWTLLQPTILWWIGDTWMIDDLTLGIVLVNFLLNGLQQSVVAFSNASGIFWATRYKPLFECLINLGVSIWLALLLGLPGVFIGTAASFFGSFWVSAYALYHKEFHLSVARYFARFFLYLGCSVAVAFCVRWLCDRYIAEATIPMILLRLVVCIAAGLFLTVPFLKTEEFDYFKKMLAGLLSKFLKRKQ